MQIYNTENLESIPYPLNRDLRLREPGDDDDFVPSSGSWWVPSDISFNPETFTEKAVQPEQIALNYLDKYAQVGGGQKGEEKRELTEAEIRSQVAGEMARSSRCLNQAAHFDGSESQDFYHHVLNCRKPWCSICGGKGGVIAKTRKRAIREKFDVSEYGIMQFVFTTPMQIRKNLQSRKKLNSLFRDAKQVTAKYFGDPSRTKRKSNGEVKEYSFGDELAIGFLHLFGDPDKKGKYREGTAGTFNPHPNVHVYRKSNDLFVSPGTLDAMRKDWKIRISKYGQFEGDVDIHFLYVKQSAKGRKKNHKIKYMVKPPLQENIEAVKEEGNLELLKLITIDMKGFQYLRFWGGLSSYKKAFRDEVGIYPANIEEIEERIQEKLIFRSVTNWNLKSYLEADEERERQGKERKLKRIAENFYRERAVKGNYEDAKVG